MFQTGLASVTFRKMTPAQIVEITARAKLKAIEWGGDVHVPHGELSAAKVARELTHNAGLQVAAYGSYYRVGHSKSDGLPFESVLETALQLGAPTIRVWAGTQNAGEANEKYRAQVVSDLWRICELAADARVLVALEFHCNTLTDSAASTLRLLKQVRHQNLKTLWQPRAGASTPEAKADLELLLPHLAHLHVFHWHATQRCPLQEGAVVWHEYLALAAKSGQARAALIEFVCGDEPSQFLEDARALKNFVRAFEN